MLSFDNVVGAAEQRLRHIQAERLGSLQIDDQFELSRLFDRQIGRFRAYIVWREPNMLRETLAANNGFA